jgi:hypothetical protein
LTQTASGGKKTARMPRKISVPHMVFGGFKDVVKEEED